MAGRRQTKAQQKPEPETPEVETPEVEADVDAPTGEDLPVDGDRDGGDPGETGSESSDEDRSEDDDPPEGAPDDEDSNEASELLKVLVPFAYGTRTDGEVRQLVKGDVVDPGEYTKESVAHLESIGFVGSEK